MRGVIGPPLPVTSQSQPSLHVIALPTGSFRAPTAHGNRTRIRRHSTVHAPGQPAEPAGAAPAERLDSFGASGSSGTVCFPAIQRLADRVLLSHIFDRPLTLGGLFLKSAESTSHKFILSGGSAAIWSLTSALSSRSHFRSRATYACMPPWRFFSEYRFCVPAGHADTTYP